MENPIRSALFKLGWYERLHRRAGFFYVDANMCMNDSRHPVTCELIWKGLRLLTNAPWMVALGRLRKKSHTHTQLAVQHTSASAAYPWIFPLSYAKQLASATRWLALVKQSFPVRRVDPCMSCVRDIHYSGHWPDILLTFLSGELDEARIDEVSRELLSNENALETLALLIKGQ